MKIIHIESGLGNQMLSYCELLAIRKMNPNDSYYVETIVFDIPECNETICQWNGYELGRVFNIDTPNVRELFDDNTWNALMTEVRESQFWNNHWNWPVYITKALNNAGLNLINLYGDREYKANPNMNKVRLRSLLKKSEFIYALQRSYLDHFFQKKRIAAFDQKKMVYIKSDDNLFTGQRLSFKYRNNGIEIIKDDIDEAFKFPPFKTKRNSDFAHYLETCNSVFIHARRGDMLSANGWCYKYGYFKRAVKYIKKHVDAPVFVFFTNTGSIEWCKENAKIFGLDYSKDTIRFVDWNTGHESFRDMQLMGLCKHGIITNSTFGWWGAYFIKNINKITISPLVEINTTHHC